ncbi:MAG: DNA gyrase C-terminal beta-propeller domain-containing protein, partial [Halothece sp.]
LEAEVNELRGEIEKLETLLGDRKELLKSLKKELRGLKRRYSNERRTRIVTETKSPSQEKTAKKQTATPTKVRDQPSDSALIEITQQERIYWCEQPTEEKGSKSKDFVVFRDQLKTETPLIAITDSGKAYAVKKESVSAGYQQKTPLKKVLQGIGSQSEEACLHYGYLPQQDLILLTQQGRVKRLSASEVANIGNRGLTLLKLKERDRVVDLCLTTEEEDLLLATSAGRILRFKVDEIQVPPMGRSAQGNLATRLRQNEQPVGCLSLSPDDSFLVISELGYGKRIPVNAIRRGSRGDIGTQGLQFVNNSDRVSGMIPGQPDQGIVKLLSDQGRVFTLNIKDVPFWGKDGVGDRVVKLKGEERITQLIPLDLT